jgi:uncharacterized LabA/DUF88 family protein
MEKSVIMIDGGFFKKKYLKEIKTPVDSGKVKVFADKVHNTHCKKFDLLRIYYYDCCPAKGIFCNPVSKVPYNLGTTLSYTNGIKFLNDLKRTDYFAVREGVLKVFGWKLVENATPQPNGTFLPGDYRLNMQQKGVDTKIGLDIAWISFQKIASRIIIVTGDSDFLPAIKLARRQGIQVFLLTLEHGVSPELKDNADVLDESNISNFL